MVKKIINHATVTGMMYANIIDIPMLMHDKCNSSTEAMMLWIQIYLDTKLIMSVNRMN